VVEHFFAISSLQKQKTKSPIPISEDHHRVLRRSGVSLSSPIATTACVGVTISSSHGLRIKLLPASCLRNEPPLSVSRLSSALSNQRGRDEGGGLESWPCRWRRCEAFTRGWRWRKAGRGRVGDHACGRRRR
jgi:hypothetical protein